MTAEQIINGVLAKKRMARADLLRGKTFLHTRARLQTIHLLRKEGFSKTDIARALGKTRDGMTYWLSDEWKESAGAARWNGIADGKGWDVETNSIVIQVCNEHKIYPAEFFGKGRDRRITNARRDAMRIMDNRGFSKAAIARLLKLHYKTVIYWTDHKYREYSMRNARASLARSIERRMAA